MKIITTSALAAALLTSGLAVAAETTELMAPTAEDYAKAHAAKGEARSGNPEDTKITVRHNQDGQVVEYVVLPSTTKIPYTVKPQAPTAPSRPGHTDTVQTPTLVKLPF
jgi:Cu/Ag efflux protein CusF